MLLQDFFTSLKVWRVWGYLGIQDVKARFRRSVVGPLWLFINLGMFVLGAGVVYGLMFKQDMSEFLPFLTSGFVIWGFILSSLTDGGYAFINAEGYIKQFSYPKQIYLLRTLVSQAVIFCIGVCAVIGVLLFYHKFVLLGWLYALPGAILLFLCGLAHISITAYMTCKFRDIPHGLGGIFQVLFFVTPIMFPVSILRERGIDFVYQFNPLYYLIEVVRYPLLQGAFAPVEFYLFGCVYFLIVAMVAFLVALKMDHKVVFLL